MWPTRLFLALSLLIAWGSQTRSLVIEPRALNLAQEIFERPDTFKIGFAPSKYQGILFILPENAPPVFEAAFQLCSSQGGSVMAVIVMAKRGALVFGIPYTYADRINTDMLHFSATKMESLLNLEIEFKIVSPATLDPARTLLTRRRVGLDR